LIKTVYHFCFMVSPFCVVGKQGASGARSGSGLYCCKPLRVRCGLVGVGLKLLPPRASLGLFFGLRRWSLAAGVVLWFYNLHQVGA